MAIIPLKQKVKIFKPAEKDDWGYVIEPGEIIELPARVDEVTEIATNQAGEEIVTGVEVILDGLANVLYDDEVEFTDELDRTTKRKPVKIEPVRMVNGKAVLTVVKL